jgi:hypothetical protein
MIKRSWTSHGTKLLGFATTIVSSVLAANAMIPQGQPALVEPGQMRWLILANIILGALTVKRGFTNTKTQAANEPSQ